ncbi:DUF6463 family protein [Psychrobium sp. 1_MG-2023]|uniref:DUF6463 family protein n=1 Tax=Psychrobium sp. 1_MG-2023 TaxID=3062624 RepID=UPI000C348817|nr:DUF6463 family protein [Psychrobium sp. 1_MG-2023]MDP2562798.1 DUF6463 family protein [Psychrobium sp. 1_MG-2023]PKF54453.1 hypothetical protein CW748_15905 [Alteromonadales bacterium alter-6D02]
MKYSGHFLTITGIIHTLIGLVLGWPIIVDMHNAGWFSSTVIDGQMMFDREAISWFLFAGLFWVIFGLTLQSAIAQGFNPPKSLGWGFVVIGIIVAIIMPASGAYLFIIQGAILVFGHHRFKQQATQLA